MRLNAYQQGALNTAEFPHELKVIYPTLGLVGEAGEVAEKIKKQIRDRGGIDALNAQDIDGLKKELGDVLWYVAVLADDLGLDLESVAEANLEKLASRKKRGVLGGSGDNR